MDKTYEQALRDVDELRSELVNVITLQLKMVSDTLRHLYWWFAVLLIYATANIGAGLWFRDSLSFGVALGLALGAALSLLILIPFGVLIQRYRALRLDALSYLEAIDQISAAKTST